MDKEKGHDGRVLFLCLLHLNFIDIGEFNFNGS